MLELSFGFDFDAIRSVCPSMPLFICCCCCLCLAINAHDCQILNYFMTQKTRSKQKRKDLDDPANPLPTKIGGFFSSHRNLMHWNWFGNECESRSKMRYGWLMITMIIAELKEIRHVKWNHREHVRVCVFETDKLAVDCGQCTWN